VKQSKLSERGRPLPSPRLAGFSRQVGWFKLSTRAVWFTRHQFDQLLSFDRAKAPKKDPHADVFAMLEKMYWRVAASDFGRAGRSWRWTILTISRSHARPSHVIMAYRISFAVVPRNRKLAPRRCDNRAKVSCLCSPANSVAGFEASGLIPGHFVFRRDLSPQLVDVVS